MTSTPPTPAAAAGMTTPADGILVLVCDAGEMRFSANCPNCPDGTVYGSAAIPPAGQPDTRIQDFQACCDRCGTAYLFDIGWCAEWREPAEDVREVRRA